MKLFSCYTGVRYGSYDLYLNAGTLKTDRKVYLS